MLKLMTKVQKSPKLQIVKKHILVGMWFARWSRRWELREREKEDMGLMKKEAKTEKKKCPHFYLAFFTSSPISLIVRNADLSSLVSAPILPLT